MTFDNIARQHGAVAGSEIVRHPEAPSHSVDLRGFEDADSETILLQMPDPAGTTAAIGIFMHSYGWLLSGRGC
jgi:hypothetical protein